RLHRGDGFQQWYKRNCKCEIIPCYSPPCGVTSKRQCLWTDMLLPRRDPMKANQVKYLACVNKGDGLCTWESQKAEV
ncbi:hypothetical protein GDO86_014452, partial [Hymenochirus boettgeri]